MHKIEQSAARAALASMLVAGFKRRLGELMRLSKTAGYMDLHDQLKAAAMRAATAPEEHSRFDEPPLPFIVEDHLPEQAPLTLQ